MSHTKVGELLKALGFSLQSNRKTREGKQHPDRNAPFEYIAQRVKSRLRRGQPALSVDTKKKEVLGKLKNAGKTYRRKGRPIEVDVHDFPDKRLGKAIPYGVYDIGHNEAGVSVGITHDTAEFAVGAIRRWWQRLGMETSAAQGKLNYSGRLATYFSDFKGALVNKRFRGAAVLSLLTFGALGLVSLRGETLRADDQPLPPAKSVEDDIQQGDAALQSGDKATAVRYFSRAIAAAPKETKALLRRGSAFLSANRFDQAIGDFSGVLAIEPKNAFALEQRGVAYGGANKLQKAIGDFTAALVINPKSTGALVNRGYAYSQIGLAREALADFNAALVIEPKNVAALNSRGGLRTRQKKTAEAIADFRAAIELEPRNPESYHNLAVALEQQGDLELAVSTYGKAIEVNPKFGHSYLNRASVYRKLGYVEKAKADEEKAKALAEEEINKQKQKLNQ